MGGNEVGVFGTTPRKGVIQKFRSERAYLYL
jgi:hypothetical protein